MNVRPVALLVVTIVLAGPPHMLPRISRREVSRDRPIIWSRSIPTPRRMLRDYADFTHNLLQVPDGLEAAVMIYRPSFSAEGCLVLHASAGKSPEYILIHTRASENIWFWMIEGKRGKVLISRREAPIPPALARRVCMLWGRMLRETRYPDPENVALRADGETFEFRQGRMFGETWSPRDNAPRFLVELGTSLVEFCSLEVPKRPDGVKAIEAKCLALETYLGGKRTP